MILHLVGSAKDFHYGVHHQPACFVMRSARPEPLP
jgi:hypothetical protein